MVVTDSRAQAVRNLELVARGVMPAERAAGRLRPWRRAATAFLGLLVGRA